MSTMMLDEGDEDEDGEEKTEKPDQPAEDEETESEEESGKVKSYLYSAFKLMIYSFYRRK